MITIQSIQIGTVRSEGDPETRDVTQCHWTSAFDKQPLAGKVTVSPTGIIGDEVADTRVHGGPEKAILCYAASHYESWSAELPGHPWAAGGFGENLTLASVDEHSVYLGDVYTAGDCVLQVSQPRQPCWKISRRWQIKTLTKLVAQTGRTGWYVRVLSPGTLQAGDTLSLTDRPHPDWTVARANDVLFGRESERLSVIELMNITELSDEWKSSLA
ncbi:MOSC domain-containing protein [Stieleria varia]|uniref:6-N-hydroxylaminopurine resistance protein n=1 Tax=Stieleria varia TaxID=2528005 RepID=A0A5C6AFR6_9BACT|nr:MOSC domain-containing protein [Stieleria varia]TWT98267.1 6-N-hydroxylaminopurine resistance protein [Stieleria varia]